MTPVQQIQTDAATMCAAIADASATDMARVIADLRGYCPKLVRFVLEASK